MSDLEGMTKDSRDETCVRVSLIEFAAQRTKGMRGRPRRCLSGRIHSASSEHMTSTSTGKRP